MANFSSLSYELEGRPKILDELHDVDGAIAKGLITAETPVTVYLTDSSKSLRPAGEHSVLAPLFAKYAPPEPEPEPEAPPVAAADPAAKADATVTYQDTRPVTATVAPAEPRKEPELVMPTLGSGGGETGSSGGNGNDGGGKSNTGMVIALILAAVIIAFLLFKLISGGEESDFVPESVEAGTVIDEQAARSMSEADLAAQSSTYYMARWAKVRSGPSAKAREVGQVDRGEEVTGVFVPSQTDPNFKWLRLTSGRFAGQYVSEINLIGNVPPPIDSSQAGEYNLVQPTDLYVGPSEGSGKIGKAPSWLPSGEFVRVFGDVGGMAEIEHKDGGVAYIPWTAIFGDRYAYVNEGDDSDFVEPSGEAAVADAAPEVAMDQPAAGSGGRMLYIVNRCNKTLNLLFTYQVGGRWMTNNDQSWAIPPRTNTYLDYAGSGRVRVSSGEIFYKELNNNRQNREYNDLYFPSYDAIYFNGTTRAMQRVVPGEVTADRYGITFC